MPAYVYSYKKEKPECHTSTYIDSVEKFWHTFCIIHTDKG